MAWIYKLPRFCYLVQILEMSLAIFRLPATSCEKWMWHKLIPRAAIYEGKEKFRFAAKQCLNTEHTIIIKPNSNCRTCTMAFRKKNALKRGKNASISV